MGLRDEGEAEVQGDDSTGLPWGVFAAEFLTGCYLDGEMGEGKGALFCGPI